MRAMILAAGRGKRMRPLTDTTPKPLLTAGGKPLIVWHIERLVAAGITQIIINHAWLGEQIEHALGDGSAFGAQLAYSPEATALETAGGIAKALPFFGEHPFLVMNGDVWCDWDPAQAVGHARGLVDRNALAWLLLVDNPPHHPEGDFLIPPLAPHALTFSGIGIYRPDLFAGVTGDKPVRLAPLLHQALKDRQVEANRHTGYWTDVGTPDRLETLNQNLVRPS